MLQKQLNLGPYCSRSICRLEVTILPGSDGLVCGTFTWENGSIARLNNLDNNGDGPGLAQVFSATDGGLTIAANWFVCRYEKSFLVYKMSERRAKRRERQEREERIRKSQEGLSGGVTARPAVCGVSL